MLTVLLRGIRAALESLLARRNLTIVSVNEIVAPHNFLKQIYRELGIDLLIDVGANAGIAGTEFRAMGYEGRIVSFEPQRSVFEKLLELTQNDRLWECRCLALGDSTGSAHIQVSGMSVSSSMLPMNSEHVRVWPESRMTGSEEVQMARLDDLATELGISDYQTLLKIDVQGFESAVLRGAKDSLSKIVAVHVELLFAPLYEGQSRYLDVMADLDAAGFRFIGMFDSYFERNSFFPVFANALFARSKPRG